MKKIFSIVALLAFAGSVYAGCPSKPIHGKVVGFDEESKTLTVAQGKKEKKVQIGSKTEMVGVDCQLSLPKVPVLRLMVVTAKTRLHLRLLCLKAKERKKRRDNFLLI